MKGGLNPSDMNLALYWILLVSCCLEFQGPHSKFLLKRFFLLEVNICVFVSCRNVAVLLVVASMVYWLAKEGVLRIFIALKNPSPQPGLNPRPLDPVASTLITTPARRLTYGYKINVLGMLPTCCCIGEDDNRLGCCTALTLLQDRSDVLQKTVEPEILAFNLVG
jgi:hypothetical protein